MLVFFVVVIVVLIIYLSGRPSYDNTRVTDALLTEFDLTNNNSTLNYDLAVEIALRNPSNIYRSHYNHINITAIYKNQAFGIMNYTSFSQGPNHETHLTPSFRGQYSLNLGAGDDLSKSGVSGADYYDIFIKLNLENESVKKFRPHWKFHRKLEYTCELKVPLISNGQSAGGNRFNTTRCTYI
ncbi:hypothetical protein M0R45_015763 [Rubus argutus]|uniref:Late embryogenesis abundant protein LEA-2 subgroup domain-containing protein n=1 Tax=Rubus argutus TaxID=59490 RepID=A0AAW1XR63_RUBAR